MLMWHGFYGYNHVFPEHRKVHGSLPTKNQTAITFLTLIGGQKTFSPRTALQSPRLAFSLMQLFLTQNPLR